MYIRNIGISHASKNPNVAMIRLSSIPLLICCLPLLDRSGYHTVPVKSSTGVSLNDTLRIGPTMHPSLVDILICFRLHRIALVADVGKMYRAVGLTDSDKDFRRFVWREGANDVLTDLRMTRLTFGVSASSFAAIMSIIRQISFSVQDRL